MHNKYNKLNISHDLMAKLKTLLPHGKTLLPNGIISSHVTLPVDSREHVPIDLTLDQSLSISALYYMYAMWFLLFTVHVVILRDAFSFVKQAKQEI